MAQRSYVSRHPIATTFMVLTVLVVAIAGYFFFRFKHDAGTRQEVKQKGLNLAGQWMETNVKDMQFRIKSITEDSLKAQMNMMVHNTLPVKVHVDSMNYIIALEGDTLIRGWQREPVDVEASADGKVSLPMHTDMRKLSKKIDQLQRDSADVFIRTIVYTKFPVVGSKSLPLEVNQRVYIPKLPKFEVEKVKVDKLGLKGGQLSVRVKVTNYASIPFTIRSMSYRFRLSDNVDVEGKETQDISFNKKGTETVEIPVKMDLDQVGEAAFKMLFKSKSTPYKMDGTMMVSTQKDFVGDFDMNYSSSGTVEELKDAAKQAIEAKKEVDKNEGKEKNEKKDKERNKE